MPRPLIPPGELIGRSSAPQPHVASDDDLLTTLEQLARLNEAKRYRIVIYPSTDTAPVDRP